MQRESTTTELVDEITRLRAENGRMRAALRKVPLARMRQDYSGLECVGCGAGPESPCRADCYTIAIEAALAGGAGSDG